MEVGYFMIVKYSACNLYGKHIRGRCKYDNLDELKNKLEKEGYYIYKTSNNKKFLHRLFFIKPGTHSIMLFCSKLSIMISSGISISNCFNNLEMQTKNIFSKSILNGIKRGVLEGNSLYDSMSRFKEVFPNYMIEMIRVGEESGKLEEILKELSKYYEQIYKMHSNVKSAMIYPVITFVTAVFVIIFLVTSVLPQFLDVLTMNNGKIPFSTQIMINIFSFFKNYYIEIVLVQISILFAVYRGFKNIKVKHILDSIKIHIPYLSKIYNNILMLKIAFSMSILSISGINILKSLEITSKTIRNRIVNEKINNSIEKIKSGESINSAFEKEKIGNELFISMIKTGEETGKLDLIFKKLKIMLEEDVNRSLKIMVSFIEPFTIILLSFFIGIFVIAAIMPVFNIMDSIS